MSDAGTGPASCGSGTARRARGVPAGPDYDVTRSQPWRTAAFIFSQVDAPFVP